MWLLKNSCRLPCQMVSRQLMSRRRQASPSEKPPSKLGRYLRELRENRAQPQWRVAAAARMDSASLSKIELGERLPTQEQAALLAAFFEVPASDMEGRRIVAKFWQENGDNPAVAEAIQ